jgi:drug/metabolite transporter (DMT)-like permease
MEKYTRMTRSTLLDLALLFVAFIWGSTFYLVKDSLIYVHPVVQVAYRFLLASFIMALGLLIARKKLGADIKSGVTLGTLLWLVYIFQTVGLETTTPSNSAFITGLFVLFLPIFSYIIFRKSITWMRWIAIALAIFGVWFITGGLGNVVIGDFYTLVAAASFGMHIIVAGQLMQKGLDPYVLAFQQFFIVGFWSLILALITGVPFVVAHPKAYSMILFLALVPTIIAFVIQLIAQKSVNPVKIGLIFSLEPVFAAIFAWTIAGETMTTSSVIGGLCIVLAMMVSEIPETYITKIWTKK